VIGAREAQAQGSEVIGKGVRSNPQIPTPQAGSRAVRRRGNSAAHFLSFGNNYLNHAGACVRGKVLTNGLENFWSLLKRSIGGSYVSLEPFHLLRYDR
jgi:hypothetical protein